ATSEEPKKRQPKKLNYWKADWDSFNNHMKNYEWSTIFRNTNSTEEINTAFYNRIWTAIENSVPNGIPRARKYSKKYRKLRNERNKLQKNLEKSKYPETEMI
ncbi:hypothetical protein, partial [Klebsiella pneumoniae]|uniref:hypothetical protein n=1 Tax=Klebsiella pneumoniae TaxID=573 RepID=UPI003EB6F33B